MKLLPVGDALSPVPARAPAITASALTAATLLGPVPVNGLAVGAGGWIGAPAAGHCFTG
jgi:hypothetical protein